jgi:hypothetical protein
VQFPTTIFHSVAILVSDLRCFGLLWRVINIIVVEANWLALRLLTTTTKARVERLLGMAWILVRGLSSGNRIVLRVSEWVVPDFILSRLLRC